MMETNPTLFGQLPASAAARWPDATALTFEGTHLSFTDVSHAVDRAARALLARGITKGDVVGLWVPNRPEFIVAFYAIEKIGAIAAPLNTRYRQDDLGFVLRHAECKLLITVERSGPVDYVGIVESVIPEFRNGRLRRSAAFPHLESIVVIAANAGDGANFDLSWERFLAGANDVTESALDKAADDVRPDDLALMIFTSGTTGNPKAVLHDHSCVRNVRERALSWPLRAGDTTLNYLPMFHIYSLGEMIMACMMTGCRQVIMDAFDAEQSLRLIEQERVNGIHGFETHYADLMRAHDRLQTDMSSVRFGTLPSGMESSTAVALQVQERFCPTVSGFGMSESWGWTCICTLDDTPEQRCATSGRPLPGTTVKIVDPLTGQEVPAGTPGEILFRGYTVTRGYFREPEATARTIDADGWLHTGDQGLVREDGFLRFLGRYKEMLKVGGENVSPAAVEQELTRLVPSILQVAVVGYPDERLMQVPLAYVVTKPGLTCTAEQVMAACKGKIASFKIPRHVILVPELPATASGKVQRVLLRARALRDLPPS